MNVILPADESLNTGHSASIKLTSQCNNHCSFCSVKHFRSGDKRYLLPYSVIEEQLILLSEKKTEEIIFVGGEPSIHPQIVEIIQKAHQLKFRQIQIGTNGRRFAYPDFCQSMIQAGLTSALVSLHAHEETLAEELSQARGSFTQTIAGLHQLRRLHIASLGIAIVLLRKNLPYLDEIIQLAMKFQPEHLRISYCIPHGGAGENPEEFIPPIQDCLGDVTALIEQWRHHTGTQWHLRGFPPCLLDAKYHSFLEKLEYEHRQYHKTELESILPNLNQTGDCLHCQWRFECLFPMDELWKCLNRSPI